ncbi:MAG: PleD family two-component system response regulator, partial [Alphaproteobacteria bacterium]|nr:PleD family two-component system response regulator [Alphaproteobacteria bacterium]
MTGTVLVVDDIPANLKLLEAKLLNQYFEILTAPDGETALEIAEAKQPDIILLDVMLPGMDGFETCQRLKANAKTNHIPVIMVTALSDAADRVRGLQCGADDFLTKPLNDTALFARVRSLVRLKLLTDSLRSHVETNDRMGILIANEQDNRDIGSANILLIEDDHPHAEHLQRTLAEENHFCDDCANGKQAQQILNASHVDLIMLAMHLDGDDSLRILSQIRSNEKSRNIPVLVLTEEGDEMMLAKALDMGVTDYVTRPVDANELKARVRTQIRRRRFQERLRDIYEKSLSLAHIDELTGLYNRRYFNNHLETLFKKTREQGGVLAVMMVDIDFFKKINDTYGHDGGDVVLKQVASRLQDAIRGYDIVARLGGEEFAMIMPALRSDQAPQAAERLRQRIADEAFTLPDGQSVDVTVSIGLFNQTLHD